MATFTKELESRDVNSNTVIRKGETVIGTKNLDLIIIIQ